MWTDTTRSQYARKGLALPSDLTDTEWALLEPFFPAPDVMVWTTSTHPGSLMCRR